MRTRKSAWSGPPRRSKGITERGRQCTVSLEQRGGLEETPNDHGRLLGDQVVGLGEGAEVLGKIARGVVPAAMHVDARPLGLAMKGMLRSARS